jgi:hypothetical protein
VVVLAGELDRRALGGDIVTTQAYFTETVTEQSVVFGLPVEGLAGTGLDATSMVEEVAKVVSSIPVIGMARNALQVAGWTATIAANRITVDEGVLAQFIPATVGPFGPINARWIVYAADGTHPVWVVGAEQVA